jgi:hypothetical protein
MDVGRRRVRTMIAVSGLAVMAACGPGTDRATHGPTTTTTTPITTIATTTTGIPRGAVPTLGRLVGDFLNGNGFGQVKPTTVFNGGDPTGLVSGVAWKSWGGATATGTGISDYVGPDQSVAGGSQEPASVVAFDLGTCDGTLMYQAVEWYFPQHGMTFDPDHYENICTGTYVPSS